MNLVRNRALGVYISIPFCRSKCTYCNFASGVYPASKHGHYVNRLVQDLEQSGAWARSMAVDLPRQVDSVYLGGGTPSLLAPKLVTQLFGALHSELDLDPDAEITVECAPSQLADETLEALVAAGVAPASRSRGGGRPPDAAMPMRSTGSEPSWRMPRRSDRGRRQREISRLEAARSVAGHRRSRSRQNDR